MRLWCSYLTWVYLNAIKEVVRIQDCLVSSTSLIGMSENGGKNMGINTATLSKIADTQINIIWRESFTDLGNRIFEHSGQTPTMSNKPLKLSFAIFLGFPAIRNCKWEALLLSIQCSMPASSCKRVAMTSGLHSFFGRISLRNITAPNARWNSKKLISCHVLLYCLGNKWCLAHRSRVEVC